MSSSYGENLRLTIFGQSHSPAIGVSIDGLPAGHPIDLDALSAFLARRAPGQSALSTARREADEFEILSGLSDGKTCGAPLAAIIRNTKSLQTIWLSPAAWAAASRTGQAIAQGPSRPLPFADEGRLSLFDEPEGSHREDACPRT